MSFAFYEEFSHFKHYIKSREAIAKVNIKYIIKFIQKFFQTHITQLIHYENIEQICENRKKSLDFLVLVKLILLI
jgi:hypothetical protein